MRLLLLFLACCIHVQAHSELQIFLTQNECLFVKCPVPKKGIVCSNHDRVMRLAEKLSNKEVHTASWGPFVVIGEYKGEKIFVAKASVGTGSGLLFTELFVNGAEYIIRYGSDDVKLPPESDAFLVKIVDEADNLYGFELQSGIDATDCGKSLFASQKIVQALTEEAKQKKINYEMRICHHLENYHALRQPEKYAPDRRMKIYAMLQELEKNEKKASYDMETAVLFRVAKDFDKHAANILQTVSKEHKSQFLRPEDELTHVRKLEEELFFPYVLDALLRITYTQST